MSAAESRAPSDCSDPLGSSLTREQPEREPRAASVDTPIRTCGRMFASSKERPTYRSPGPPERRGAHETRTRPSPPGDKTRRETVTKMPDISGHLGPSLACRAAGNGLRGAHDD